MSASLHSFDQHREKHRQMPDQPVELDPRIREVLTRLPREQAGADFTARVLERTAKTKTRRQRLRSLAAAAAFCAFGAFGTHQWNESQARHAAAERVAQMELEYQMLQRELLELERVAQAQRPVVYLGGHDDVEYVIDLSRLSARRNVRTASTSSL